MTHQDSNQTNTTESRVIPDLSHRFSDFPQNEIINASNQIQTVLSFLYTILEPADTLPPAHVCTVERLHADKESLKEQVNDALFIIDSLNRDVKAVAQTIKF